MLLEKEIENLNQIIMKMATLIIDNLNYAFNVYKHYQEGETYYVNDDLIDGFERVIEELCLDIILRERPYAKDLRMVSGILKLVSDLERIGDHAEDVLEYSLKLKSEREHNLTTKIENMLEVALDMVKKSISSFIKGNIEEALDVIKTDDVIDKEYEEVLDYLVVHDKESSASVTIYTTLVVKYIERIADHSVNIAEWVIYIQNGFHKDKKIF